MPAFRFIIEGKNLNLPARDEAGDYLVTGFFTSRRIRAKSIEEAKAKVLRGMQEEWREHDPVFKIIDGWRTGIFELRIKAKLGHAFFSDDFSMCEAAQLTGEAARAPCGSAIWGVGAKSIL